MKAENRSYYLARAQQELAAANSSSNHEIGAIHRSIADRYLELLGVEGIAAIDAPVRTLGLDDGEGNSRQIPRSEPASLGR